MPRLLGGGFVSPSLRWWSSWWWPLVHLRSFRCRLLDGSHYTRPTYVVQIEPTQTTPKPLQTLAFIGVSQPHDGDTKTADTTATATPRHDGHGHDRIRGTCPRDTTRHAKTQSHKRSNVAPCNKHPRGGVSPRRKKQGRWVSGLKAECDFRGYLEKLGHGATGWNGAVFAVLASGGASWCGIFSGCNRFCTLHIVYNVPWIDVDGGRAQLGSASISGCYHSLRVA